MKNINSKKAQINQQNSKQKRKSLDQSMGQGQPLVNNQPSALIINNRITNREVQAKEDLVPVVPNSSISGEDSGKHHCPLPNLDFSNIQLLTCLDIPYFPTNDEIEKSKAEFLEQINHFPQEPF